MTEKNKDLAAYVSWKRSPLKFIKDMWKLHPQPILPEFRDIPWRELKAEHFDTFIKGKHITWQQWQILMGVEEAIQKRGKKWISVASGRGCGKSSTMAMILIWFLFCHYDALVPCTAPGIVQLYDVLWKEVSLWIKKLPKPIQAKFEWQKNYVRIVDRPTTWFATARTARKEKPEALAGFHANHVCILCDEASGVDDAIFETAMGTLTNENVLFLMISNPRRLNGFFYRSHHKDRSSWQTFQFDARESPIVEEEFMRKVIEDHGMESDQFRIEVAGQFPREDAVDDKGYVPLFMQNDIRKTEMGDFVGTLRMGVDCAGEGSDSSVWVVRDNFRAKVVAKEKISNPQSIAAKTAELIDYYELNPSLVYVDNFGEGANVAQHLAMIGKFVNPVNVGEQSDEPEVHLNKRSESYWRLKEWIRYGGELVNHSGWDELLSIRYRRNLKGKIQIMSKQDMRREGMKSPDHVDALALTFFEESGQLESSPTPIYDFTNEAALG